MPLRPDRSDSLRLDRRHFLKGASALALAGVSPRARAGRSPNEKLNVAMVGVAHRAAENLKEVSGENIVALCDVDDLYLDAAMAKFPAAARYNDFRKMLERNDIDAVVVATPDHTHAVAASAAMKSGRPVYCEKPLTHSVYEARFLQELAAKTGLPTQMGTQIHARDNYRRVVEAVRSGAIGPVHEAHVWVAKDWAGGDPPTDKPPVPPNLHWDLWLGPAPERPYSPRYVPQHWRRWWDFGGGTLADMGCHYTDLVFWALNLKYPLSVRTTAPEPAKSDGAGKDLSVEWEFPARPDDGIPMPALRLTWHDGDARPGQLADYGLSGSGPETAPGTVWGSGVLFVGSKGAIVADYDRMALLPKDRFEGWQPPPQTIPASIGHHQEWIQACKGGARPLCSFDYSGPLTETILLGNLAYRSAPGERLAWDAAALRVTNHDGANAFVRREYRAGWSL